MFGIILILLNGVSEKLSFYYLSSNKTYQEIKVALAYYIIAIFFLLYAAYCDALSAAFLDDWKFYLILVLDVALISVTKANYNRQNDFASVGFAMFSTVYLIFPFSYVMDSLLEFKVAIKLPYASLEEAVGFSLLFFVLTLLYYYDKMHLSKIASPLLLLVQAIVMLNSIYFTSAAVQMYDAFFMFVFMLCVTATTYLLYAKFFKKESVITAYRTGALNDKSFWLYMPIALFSAALFILGAQLIAVEIIALTKRNSQLMSSMLIDKYLFHRELIFKDISIVGVIFIITFIIYGNFFYVRLIR